MSALLGTVGIGAAAGAQLVLFLMIQLSGGRKYGKSHKS